MADHETGVLFINAAADKAVSRALVNQFKCLINPFYNGPIRPSNQSDHVDQSAPASLNSSLGSSASPNTNPATLHPLSSQPHPIKRGSDSIEDE